MDILNDILAALSVGLDALFPDIPVYPETVPDGVPPRCFLIGFAGGVEICGENSGRQAVSGKLDITYLAPQKQDELETKRELNRVYSTLALNLILIRSDNVVLRLKRHKRQDDGSDGVLHDLCSFHTFLLPINTVPQMQTLELEEKRITDGKENSR